MNTHYAFSLDGLHWSNGSDIATDPNVTLVGGGTVKFTNRERPQIYFNESTGEPTLLFNGTVCVLAESMTTLTLLRNHLSKADRHEL